MRKLNLKHRNALQVPELKENAINITCQMSSLLFFEAVGRNTGAYAKSEISESVLSIALIHHNSQLLNMFNGQQLLHVNYEAYIYLYVKCGEPTLMLLFTLKLHTPKYTVTTTIIK